MEQIRDATDIRSAERPDIRPNVQISLYKQRPEMFIDWKKQMCNFLFLCFLQSTKYDVKMNTIFLKNSLLPRGWEYQVIYFKCMYVQLYIVQLQFSYTVSVTKGYTF